MITAIIFSIAGWYARLLWEKKKNEIKSFFTFNKKKDG